MLDAQRVTELAEAVADGLTPDWRSEEGSSADPIERGVISKLKAVQAINSLYTTRTRVRGDEAGRTQLAPGDTWGALEIREHVGRGRFGDVYRAWDPALDREVALKIVRHSEGRDGAETKIVEEGRLMARVRHPNVVTIHGAQRIDGVSGLWMEYVEGRTLAMELAERGPYTADELTRVGIELGHALAAVHRAGLVHRDVKTQNVLRDTSGRIVLGDFGTGRELDEPEESREGLAGTPLYLAPEIFARQPAAPQSDLYSLGALLFHLATGRFPVPGRSLRELRDAHTRGDRTSLASLRPDLPAPLAEAVDIALAPDPSRRFGSAEAMTREFERCLATAPTPHRRGPRMAGIAASVLVLAALAGVAWVARRPAAPAVPFVARDFVLVTAFENRTGEPLLDGTLEYALERELANSPFARVVPRERVADTLQLMLKPTDTRVDSALGREVALRDGHIRALVGGRVEKVGGSFAMTVDIASPTDGTVLASVRQASIAQSDLLKAVGRLSWDVRRLLGEVLPTTPGGDAAPPKVTTSSFPALQLLAQAVAMQNPEGGWGARNAAAEKILKAAVKQDPEFASAHMLLSIAVRLQGDERLPEALQHIERAVAASDRTTEVERLVNVAELHGVRAFMAGPSTREGLKHQEEAAAAYEAVLQLQPDHPQALICLTNIYQQHLRRPSSHVATRLADLRPTSARWQVTAAQALLSDHPIEREAVRPYVRRAQQLGFDVVEYAGPVGWARTFDAFDAWLRDDPREALRIVDTLAADMRSRPRAVASRVAPHLLNAYLALGRLDAAAEMAAIAEPFPARRLDAIMVAMARGDRKMLRDLIARDFPTVNDFRAVTSAVIEAGLLGKAHDAVRFLQGNPRLNQAGPMLDFYEGQLALAEGRIDTAVTLLEKAAATSRLFDRTFKLAEALASKGEVDRAIGVLEDASKRRAESVATNGTRAWLWLPVRELLAQLYRRVGRVAEADAIDAELLKLLEVADEDHPIKRRLLSRRAGRAAMAVPFKARDWVLVTAVENRTGEPVLDGTLEYALERELANSPFARVVPRERVADTLQLMLKPTDTRVDSALGREVALRDGHIRALVGGRVEKVGGSFAMTVDIASPTDGTVLASVRQASITQSDLLKAVARLSWDVRRLLGEVLPTTPGGDAAPPKVTTSSFPALQLLAQAVAMQNPEGGWGARNAAAEKILKAAVKQDPEFASAHMLLSIAVRLQGDERLPEALQHIERAVAASDRTTEVERLVNVAELHGVRAFMAGPSTREGLKHQEEAAAAYEAVLQLQPDHPQALICLTNIYQQHLRRPSSHVATRLADLRPTSGWWQAAAARAILSDRPSERERALRFLQRARELEPVDTGSGVGHAVAWLFDAHEAWVRGDVHEAARVVDAAASHIASLSGSAKSVFAMHVAHAYHTLGRLNRAEEVVGLMQPDMTRQLQRLTIIGSREDPEVLRAAIQREFGSALVNGLGSALIDALLLEAARTLLAEMRVARPIPIPYMWLVDGQLALAEGRFEAAVSSFQQVMQPRLLETARQQWMRAAVKLADARSALGHRASAIGVLEEASQHRDELWPGALFDGYSWLRVRDRLAIHYRAAARVADAEAVELELSKLMAVADDDHPIKRRLVTELAHR